jgi:hypothetical protein
VLVKQGTRPIDEPDLRRGTAIGPTPGLPDRFTNAEDGSAMSTPHRPVSVTA